MYQHSKMHIWIFALYVCVYILLYIFVGLSRSPWSKTTPLSSRSCFGEGRKHHTSLFRVRNDIISIKMGFALRGVFINHNREQHTYVHQTEFTQWNAEQFSHSTTTTAPGTVSWIAFYFPVHNRIMRWGPIAFKKNYTTQQVDRHKKKTFRGTFWPGQWCRIRARDRFLTTTNARNLLATLKCSKVSR